MTFYTVSRESRPFRHCLAMNPIKTMLKDYLANIDPHLDPQ